jgi:hypothetical protein
MTEIVAHGIGSWKRRSWSGFETRQDFGGAGKQEREVQKSVEDLVTPGSHGSAWVSRRMSDGRPVLDGSRRWI